MVQENEICQVWRHLDTGRSDRGNGFEGCCERACQQLGEAVVPEEGGPSDRLPRAAAEREPLRQLGQEGRSRHQVSSGAAESHSGQEALEGPRVLTGHEVCAGQAWAPSGETCSDQLPGPF